MHKRLSVLPMLLTGLLFALACHKESSLADGKLITRSSIHDTIPNDTIRDTVPNIPDSVYQYIKGLKIVPFSIRDSSVELHIQTTNFYPTMQADLLITGSIDSSTLYIEPTGINHSGPAAASTPAKRIMHARPYNPGTYPLIVKLRGHTYTGSLTATSTQYTFNWTHDSIITIIPKVVNRVH